MNLIISIDIAIATSVGIPLSLEVERTGYRERNGSTINEFATH